jgi:hypothetical protein
MALHDNIPYASPQATGPEYFALIADVVGSRTPPQGKPLEEYTRNLKSSLEELCEKLDRRFNSLLSLRPAVTDGDSIQLAFLGNHADLAVDLCWFFLRQSSLRFRCSFGYGDIYTEHPSGTRATDGVNGPVWWEARRGMDLVRELEKSLNKEKSSKRRKKDTSPNGEKKDEPSKSGQLPIRAFVYFAGLPVESELVVNALAESCVNRYLRSTALQRMVIDALLDDEKTRTWKLAETLETSSSSISSFKKRAQWSSLLRNSYAWKLAILGGVEIDVHRRSGIAGGGALAVRDRINEVFQECKTLL